MASGATILVLRNPLRPAEREEHRAEPGRLFIDWLAEHYPAGFGRPVSVLHNARPVAVADFDFALAEGDCVAVLVNPGVPAAIGAAIVEALIVAAITAGATLLINAIFGKPQRPKAQDLPAPDPIYSITGAQNAARIGEPIPALYGRLITVPDYAAQPYTFFHENDQYLDQVLVIGWGEFDLHDVRVGETPVSALESDAVEYWLFGPADHGEEMGAIEALTGVMENVVTSPEVADQELNGAAVGPGSVEFVLPATFMAPNQIEFDGDAPDPGSAGFIQVSGTARNNGNYEIDTFTGTGVLTTELTIRDEEPASVVTFRYYGSIEETGVGPFVTCGPGATGNRIMADFVFPQGLYEIDADTGDLLFAEVELTIEYQALAPDGTPSGGWSSAVFIETRNTNTPARLTYAIDVPAGRYRVRAYRTSAAESSARHVSTLVWTGLKFRLIDAAPPVYGAVSLLVVRIRATNGIASAAASRISADLTRRLPTLGEGPLGPSTSPADAFCDIYTNPIYGAARPLAEIDLPELAALAAHWGGEASFNAGFAQRSTIWEALRISLQTAGAAPLPLGQKMSAVQDGVRALRTQLFSDANTVRGSLSVGYNFDKPGDYDGVRVEYRDPATWNAAFAVWPPGALDADLVELFGCTDATQAEGFARLLWNKRLLQRKTASFETELEGLIPRLGDRVAVASQLPRWGASGIVISVAPGWLTLDSAPEWSPGAAFVVLRNEGGEPSAAIPVAPGPGPRDIVLAEPAPFALFGVGAQEPTHYAFGTATELVRDFTISTIEHRGAARVAIEAVAYDPAVFADTLPWMETPL